MNSAGIEPRGRARNSRTESLLREVERGSIIHLTRLSGPTGWPSDTHDGSLVLGVLFNLLKKEVVPSGNPAFNPSQDWPAETVKRVRLLLGIIAGPAVKALQKEAANNSLLSKVFEKNLPTLLLWLEFVIHESARVYGELSSPDSDTSGPRFAADTLNLLYKAASDKVRMDLHASSAFIDVLLGLWNWHDPADLSLSSTYARPGSCPVTSLLTQVTRVPSVLHDLKNTFSALPAEHHQRFIRSSLRRVYEWAAFLEKASGTSPSPALLVSVVEMTQSFADVPVYMDSYVQSRFAPQALSMSNHFSHIWVSPGPGEDQLPLPVVVSTKFFPPKVGVVSIKLVRGIMPGLLKAGLLIILLDHLISQPRGTAYPWYPWAGEEDAGHPVPVLASMCVDAKIAHEIGMAIEAIGPRRMQQLRSCPWYKHHWTPFWTTFEFLYGMWTNSQRPVVVCDNFKHKLVKTSIESKQCGGCRVAIYCSAKCQREDWDAFHREECAGNHRYRIEREIVSSWLPHINRQFYLKVLRHAVLNFETGKAIETVQEWPEKSTFVEYRHGPLCASHQARIEKTKDAILRVDTLFSPIKAFLHPLDTVMNFSHGGVPTFRDPRFLAMFRELNYPTTATGGSGAVGTGRKWIRLAMCVGYYGLYRTYVFGRFLVTKWEGRTRVEALNVYVKVEERLKCDEQMATSMDQSSLSRSRCSDPRCQAC